MNISDFLLKMSKLADKIEKNIDTDKVVQAIRNSQSENMYQVHINDDRLKKIDDKIRKIFVTTNNFDICVLPGESMVIEIFMLESMNEKLLSITSDINNDALYIDVNYVCCNNANGLILIKGFDGDSVTGRTDNGDIKVEKNHAIKSFVLDSKNGDIEIRENKIERAILNSKNGSIELSGCNFLNVDIDAKNGDIDVKLLDTCELDLYSENGDIDYDRSLDVKNSRCTLKCHSKNGDITVQKV